MGGDIQKAPDEWYWTYKKVNQQTANAVHVFIFLYVAC